MQGVDKRFDNALIRYQKVKSLQKEGLSAKEIANKMGCSLNTAKKYMSMESFDMEPNNYKSAVLKSNDNVIKSVSYDQQEILCNILKLYVKQGFFDADFTYSKGVFYANGIVPTPKRKYDKYPQIDGVEQLEDAEMIEESSLKAVVVDLPFMITPEKWNSNAYMNNRFNSFDNEEEAYEANNYMLDLAFRKLKKQGVLVMKTMDVLHRNKQIWMTYHVFNEAQKIGFELIDKFVLINKSKMLNRGFNQKVARKYHCCFLVFKKA